MEELLLKMHEEIVRTNEAYTELKCILEALQDAVNECEVEEAEHTWNKRKDVEQAKISCRKIKRILGMDPDICEAAGKILLMKEMEEEEKADE